MTDLSSQFTDPFAQFDNWYAQAQASEAEYPDAFALATVDNRDGELWPDVRILLLKGVADGAFHFYTNRTSAKGRQLAGCPRAAMNFHWKSLHRQVRIGGPVSLLPDAVSDEYFATRPRASQLSAWASKQSQPLAHRGQFEEQLAEMDRRFPDAVPRPPFWGGYALTPVRIEFWEERPGRQHVRQRWQQTEAGWSCDTLYP